MKIKSIATIALSAALVTSSAFATDVTSEKPVYINGVKLEKEFINDTDGTVLIPVRDVCETLGMNVGWNEESETVIIEKLPVYITFSPYSDGYTFAKTAPMQLGKAPKLVDDTTYVPLNFAEEILHTELAFTESGVYLSTEQVKVNKVVVTEKADGAITVYDAKLGEVVANITEETKITDKSGVVMNLDSINENSLIEIEYADFMTMSLPPITNAVSITVTGEEGYEVITGTICETLDDENGKAVSIGSKDDVYGQTVLNLSEDIRVIAADGSDTDFSALKEGTNITAIASMAVTRSIPAQRGVVVVRITE